MADDRLRMIAELQNRVSAPLALMKRDMEAFGESGRDVQNVFKKFGLEQLQHEKLQRRLGKEVLPVVRREMAAMHELLKKVVPGFKDLGSQVSAFGVRAGTAIRT